MKKQTFLSLLLTFALVFCCAGAGCAAESTPEDGASSVSALNADDLFSKRDLSGDYDAESAVPVALNGDSASCDSDAVLIDSGVIQFTAEGTYLLSGTLNDGMLVVNAPDTDKVQLVLDGASVTCSTSAALYVLEADKVFLTTAPGSVNALVNAGDYQPIDENNIDAAVFSKADLTLNGAGALTITAASGHGVVSKDDLVLTGGSLTVSAPSHALSGKDSVCISGGTYVLSAGKDGIHAENDDAPAKGYLYVGGGTFDIAAGGDGLSDGSCLLIEGGEFTLQSGGGCAAAPEPSSQWSFGPGFSRQGSSSSSSADSVSTKGIKAATDLTITGGSFSIDSADDALHSNDSLTVSGGSFEIASGDDGLHADGALLLSGGVVTISRSYEGIEGLSIEISGGEIDLTASDDGLNAAGGNDSSGFGGRGGDMFAATQGASILLSGGTLHIDASGDGIDSNGSFTMTGGTVWVSGPTNSGNGALDYNSGAAIHGGTILAAGASGMSQNFGSDSTQGAMLISGLSGAAGGSVTLTDSEGQILLSWQSDKSYNCLLISCPELCVGSTYTLTVDGVSTQITMDSLLYGSGSGMGGMTGKGGMTGRDGMTGKEGMTGRDGMTGKGGMGGMPSRDGSSQAPDGAPEPPETTSGRAPGGQPT